MTKSKFSENSIYSQVFTFEVLGYFDSIATEENYDWIEKYFNVLMKDDNINAEKYNMHHIRPCCTFKTNCKTKRAETKPLADVFNGNLIKLSIYNHFFAHFYLWKIFNDKDSKIAFQRMCGQGKYIDNLTEDELKDVARLKEECAKKNQTDEERKEHQKEYCENNKEKITKRRKERYEKNKEKILKWQKDYRENNKEKRAKQKKASYEKNKEKALKRRKERYEKNKEKIREQYNNNKEEILKKQKERDARICYDPIKGDYPTYCALKNRILKHRELYGNIVASDYIIQHQS